MHLMKGLGQDKSRKEIQSILFWLNILLCKAQGGNVLEQKKTLSEWHWIWSPCWAGLMKRLCEGFGCRRASCFLLLIVPVQQEEAEAPVR